jgi:restriction endonuclease S subunit
MKKLRYVTFFLLMFAFAVSPVEAQKRDPSLTEQVRRQTFLNDVTDTIASFGKSETQKRKIIRQRKEARRLDRLKNIHARKRAQYQKDKTRRQKEIQRALRSNPPG